MTQAQTAMKLRSALIALATYALANDAQATTEIAVQTPTSAILMADSMYSLMGDTQRRYGCKIHSSNNVYWMTS
jgi:hypothetical protein